MPNPNNYGPNNLPRTGVFGNPGGSVSNLTSLLGGIDTTNMQAPITDVSLNSGPQPPQGLQPNYNSAGVDMSGLISQSDNPYNSLVAGLYNNMYGTNGTGGVGGAALSSVRMATPMSEYDMSGLPSLSQIGAAEKMGRYDMSNLPSLSEMGAADAMSQIDLSNLPSLSEAADFGGFDRIGTENLPNLTGFDQSALPELSNYNYADNLQTVDQGQLPEYMRGSYSGGTNNLRDALESQLNTQLSAAGQLTPEQAKLVAQQTRGAQGARGNYLGDSAAFEETLNQFQYSDARANQARANALGYLTSGATAFDTQEALRNNENALQNQSFNDAMLLNSQNNATESQRQANDLSALGFNNQANTSRFNSNLTLADFNNSVANQDLQNQLGLGNYNNNLTQQEYANLLNQTRLNNDTRTQGLSNLLAGVGFNNQAAQQDYANQATYVGMNNDMRNQMLQNELAGLGFNNQASMNDYSNLATQAQINNAAKSGMFQNELAALGFNNQSRTQQLNNAISATGFNNSVAQSGAASARDALSDQLGMARYLDSLSRDDQRYSDQYNAGMQNQYFNQSMQLLNQGDPAYNQNYMVNAQRNPYAAQYQGFDPLDTANAAMGGMPLPGNTSVSPWSQFGSQAAGTLASAAQQWAGSNNNAAWGNPQNGGTTDYPMTSWGVDGNGYVPNW